MDYEFPEIRRVLLIYNAKNVYTRIWSFFNAKGASQGVKITKGCNYLLYFWISG